jgi:hypothetical protein
MTGTTGSVLQLRHLDDIEPSAQRSGAFGDLPGFLSLPPPQPGSRVTSHLVA